MATKQAKLSLGLDLKQFKQGVAEAIRSMKELEALTKSINASGGIGAGGAGAGGVGGAGAGGAGGAGTGRGVMGGAMAGIRKASSTMSGVISGGPLAVGAAIGLGVAAVAFQRQLLLARKDLGLRGLAGGGSLGEESRSQYGFRKEERYERGMSVAAGAGRDLTTPQIEKFVDASEQLERAFGISGEQYGGAMGAARKAGVKDQAGFISGVVKDAQQAGLGGSMVGEYLAEMTSYLESMSKGIDIDQGSLRGMASALASIDFFKTDAGRIVEVIKGVESAFRDNDPYQQYLSFRAINAAAGPEGISPIGAEIRRGMPLIGGGKTSVTEGLRAAGFGEQARAMEIGGKEMIEKRAVQAWDDAKLRKGMSGEAQLAGGRQFAHGMGLPINLSSTIQTEMANWIASGKKKEDFKLTGKTSAKILEELKTPKEKADEAMTTFAGRMVSVAEDFDDISNKLSKEVVSPFIQAVANFFDGVSIFTGTKKREQDKKDLAEAAAAMSGVGKDALTPEQTAKLLEKLDLSLSQLMIDIPKAIIDGLSNLFPSIKTKKMTPEEAETMKELGADPKFKKAVENNAFDMFTKATEDNTIAVRNLTIALANVPTESLAGKSYSLGLFGGSSPGGTLVGVGH